MEGHPALRAGLKSSPSLRDFRWDAILRGEYTKSLITLSRNFLGWEEAVVRLALIEGGQRLRAKSGRSYGWGLGMVRRIQATEVGLVAGIDILLGGIQI